MTRKTNKGMIVGLDIGTSKVVCIVGETTPEGGLEIVGLGSQQSRGLKKGVVVDIESTVQSIQRAVEEAELMAGCEIHSVFTGITGGHIRSFNSHGMVPIRDHEVTAADVERVIEAAKTVAIPADQEVLDVSQQAFVLDDQDGIRDPVGMSGVRLEARVHIVTGAASAAQNIVKCVRRCGLEVDGILPQQLTSSQAVLSEDEKELGVCLVDIGGGTTDLAVFTEGAVRHTAVIPIAGDQITNDIAVGLRTPSKHADEIKIRHARAQVPAHGDQADTSFEVPNVGEQSSEPISRHKLARYIEPRLREILDFVRDELSRSGLEDLIAAGIVLTGGTAKMEGAIELAKSIFPAPQSPEMPAMPVRLGLPQGYTGLEDITQDPAYASAIGLLRLGQKNRGGFGAEGTEGGGLTATWHRLRRWFQGNF